MARLVNTLRDRAKNDRTTIKLTQANLNDVKWWLEHIKNCKGVPMSALMMEPKWESHTMSWTSDSSGSGMGGRENNLGQFFHFEFDEQWLQLDINSLECLALIVCARKWLRYHAGRKILVQCDNQTTVSIIESGAARHHFLQACLRELHHLCAQNSAEIKVIWIKTTENQIADALSCWHMHTKYQEQFERLTGHRRTQEVFVSNSDLQFQFAEM